jgi:hypothetical protein
MNVRRGRAREPRAEIGGASEGAGGRAIDRPPVTAVFIAIEPIDGSTAPPVSCTGPCECALREASCRSRIAPLLGDEGGPELLLYAPAPPHVFFIGIGPALFAALPCTTLCALPAGERAYYQPARLCLPPPAMAFTALRLPTCTGVLVPGVEVPKV